MIVYLITLLGFAQRSNKPLLNLVFGLTINVHQQVPPTVEEDTDEGGWCCVAKSDDLHVRIFVLELSQVPVYELSRPL